MHFFWAVRSSQKREEVKFPGNQSQFTVKCLDGCRCSDSFGGEKQILNKKQESGGVIKFTLFKKNNKKQQKQTNKQKKQPTQHRQLGWGKGGNKGVENVGLANVDQRKSKSMGRTRHRIFCKWLN